jgi:capsular polysaccharide biosynthesis protein
MDRATVRSVFDAIVKRWWLALMVLALVMIADVYYTTTRQPTYLARTTLLISPSAVAVDSGQLVYSIDTLGRGRVFGTYAEVLGSEVIHRQTLERLGIPTEELGRTIIIKSAGLAETAVIQVSVESRSPDLSAVAANVVGEIGIARLQELYPLYNLSFLNVATPPLRPYTPDPLRNYSFGLLFGSILALLIPWLVEMVARQRASRATAVASTRVSKQPTGSNRPTPGEPTRVVRGEASPPSSVRA